MAKIRIGFSTHFEIENELAGIGTDNPTNTKQVLGNIKSSDAKVIGVSTLTTFDGFTDTKLSLQGSAGAKQHTTSGEIIIEGDVTVSTGTTFTSGPENLTVTDSFTLPGISDDKPTVGTMRFNENLGALEFYTGVEWKAVNSMVDMTGGGVRGFISGGFGDDHSVPQGQRKEIQYFNVASQGNSILFGELTDYALCDDSCASSTRVVNLHGTKAAFNNTIDYFQMATTGNAIDFGDATITGARQANVSSSTRGIFCGRRTPSYVNTIDYVEMHTLGNALDFGDLTVGTGGASSGSSPTRGVVSGGYPYKQNIDAITIASKGDAVKFGEAAFTGSYQDGCSNQTRALFAGGYNIDNSTKNANISSLYIASDGNATMFGELSIKRAYLWGAGTPTRGFFGGGNAFGVTPSTHYNVIEYTSMQTGGKTVDFGDMIVRAYAAGGITDAHGGLGGF